MKSESNPMTRTNRFESVLKIPANSSDGRFNSRPATTLNFRRRTSVTFDIGSIREIEFSNENRYYTKTDSDTHLRRMSAPELPPIQDKARNSPLPTYHSSRYIRSKSSKPSTNASDSSHRQRFAKSPFSQESSESSNSNGKKLTNGYILRSKTWVPSEQTNTASTTSTLKLESIEKKGKMSTPRSTKNGFRTRLSSKDNSLSSGNNNTAQLKKKQLTHCQSEPKISPLSDYTANRQKVTLRQKSRTNNSVNNKVLSVDKTDNLTRNRYINGTVNGMRRYSSTIQLIPQKHVNYEDFEDDSGSDSDKDHMIINWLIGVDNVQAEEIPEPEIEYPDEPPQTDTALHIVYGGDS
ncbi:uncharacterized protein LOC130047137 [Ostrea edulis]|uniref:uncharacterized protein LOC130047137 n=1 Tax=Ostrea edulis TaxID=37623 RepID=UPI0024AEA06C|nr:uncharacterized protein LOC130047137 [Ostrea edulis]XP_055997531.1 uncharacterized protein LOC130047137 [Ostrea edulis]